MRTALLFSSTATGNGPADRQINQSIEAPAKGLLGAAILAPASSGLRGFEADLRAFVAVGDAPHFERLRMKRLLLLVVALTSGFVVALTPGFGSPRANETAAHETALEQGELLSGKVLEVKDVENYTYLRLQTRDGEIWAAIPRTGVEVDAQVTIKNPSPMDGFESPSLHRIFDRIVFGTLADADSHSGAHGTAAMHAAIGQQSGVAKVDVPKATGPDARTVAEVVEKTPDLNEHAVKIRGQVVKFTPNVLGKNWLHLRDGSGSVANGSNDILVVTQDEANVGDVVLVTGIVRTDRDLGSGYSYRVLIEEARLQR